VALPFWNKGVLRHTETEDILVMEARGNAFCVAERLRALKHKGGKFLEEPSLPAKWVKTYVPNVE